METTAVSLDEYSFWRCPKVHWPGLHRLVITLPYPLERQQRLYPPH